MIEFDPIKKYKKILNEKCHNFNCQLYQNIFYLIVLAQKKNQVSVGV